MITREKLRCGEGDLVEGDSDIGSRRRISRSEEMTSKGGGEHYFGIRRTICGCIYDLVIHG
jgi:hypothetical protein